MQELFKKYLRNQCSPKEVTFLLKQFEIEGKKELLSNLVIQQLEAYEDLTDIKENELEKILAQAYSNIKSQIFLKINPGLLPSVSVACVGFLMNVIVLFPITQSIGWLLNVCCKASSRSIAEL
ncbi:MAG TPA: hypothetical protein VFU29_22695 [Chitinophagaceae bacterium]|nr:hypothetical protein [Chitinophagaceae bacterium]